LGILNNRLGTPGTDSHPLLELATISEDELATLEALTANERLEWDLHSTRTTLGAHPLALLRDGLNRAGVTPSNQLEHGQKTAVAGIVLSRQRPSTANGTVRPRTRFAAQSLDRFWRGATFSRF
jgi:hypothetical protein